MAFDNVRLPEDIERGARGGPAFRTSIVTLASGHEQRDGKWSQSKHSWDIGYGLLERDDGGISETYYFQIVEFFYARRGRLRGFRFKDWTDYQINDQEIATGDDSETQFQIVKRYSSGGITHERTIRKPVAGTVSATSVTDLSSGGSYAWELSGSGTDEYYLTANGGGQPPLSNQPSQLRKDGSNLPTGTVGSLSEDEWAWADNDSLGFNTIYVRVTGGTDPDALSPGAIEAFEPPSATSVNTNAGLITFDNAPPQDASVRVTCEFDVPVRFDVDQLEIEVELHNVAAVPNIPVVETRED